MVTNMEPSPEPLADQSIQPCVLTIPFGYFIPVFWCLCFIFLYKSHGPNEPTLPTYNRRGRDEVLVAVPCRPES